MEALQSEYADFSNFSAPIRVLSPKLWISPEHHVEQVARIIITFGERAFSKFVKCKRYQVHKANLLADHDAQILNAKLPQGNPPQSMNCFNKVRIVRGLAPISLLEILKGFVEIARYQRAAHHKLASAWSRTSRRKSASCSLMHMGGEKRIVCPQSPPLPRRSPMSLQVSITCAHSSFAGSFDC